MENKVSLIFHIVLSFLHKRTRWNQTMTNDSFSAPEKQFLTKAWQGKEKDAFQCSIEFFLTSVSLRKSKQSLLDAACLRAKSMVSRSICLIFEQDQYSIGPLFHVLIDPQCMTIKFQFTEQAFLAQAQNQFQNIRPEVAVKGQHARRLLTMILEDPQFQSNGFMSRELSMTGENSIKEILGIPENRYVVWSDLRRYVLDKAILEISEKTTIRINWNYIRKYKKGSTILLTASNEKNSKREKQ